MPKCDDAWKGSEFDDLEFQGQNLVHNIDRKISNIGCQTISFQHHTLLEFSGRHESL